VHNKKGRREKARIENLSRRFSANVAQTSYSKKKMISKLNISEPSSRRYPAIIFDQEREAGDQILNVQGLGAY
jgi:hypothetical protein